MRGWKVGDHEGFDQGKLIEVERDFMEEEIKKLHERFLREKKGLDTWQSGSVVTVW